MESLFENESSMISKEDYLEYKRQFYFKREKIKQGFYFIGGIILLALGTYGVVTGRYLAASLGYILGIFYLYSAKYYYKMMIGKHYLAAQRFAKDIYNWSIYDNKAVRLTDDGKIEITYSDIKDVYLTDNCIVIYCNRTAYWIDKEGFSKGSAEEFLSFLRGKTNLSF